MNKVFLFLYIVTNFIYLFIILSIILIKNTNAQQTKLKG